MKIALAILCSLLLAWAQVVVASVPVTTGGPAAHDCGCGGKMPCCQAAPAAPASQPLSATAPAPSQNQILSPAPATVLWVLPATETPIFSPGVSPSLTAGSALIFARNCVRLI